MKQLTVWITTVLICLTATGARAANVAIDPDRLDLSGLGSQFTVEVQVDDVGDLGAFQFDIQYDSSVVSIADNSSVVIGDLLGSTGRTVEVLGTLIDSDNGTLRVAAYTTGSAGGPAGGGTLAEVTFALDAADPTDLNLKNVLLSDTAGAAIPVGAVGDAQLLELIQLSVLTTGTGTGTVTSFPAGIDCGSVCAYGFESGIDVTLTAEEDNASTFSGWDGGGCSGTGECTVELSSDTRVTADFAGPCSLEVSPSSAKSRRLLPSIKLLRITAAGIAFEAGAAAVAFSTEDIRVLGRPRVRSEDSLTALVLIKRGIAAGAYDVSVTSGEESCTLSDGFLIE